MPDLAATLDGELFRPDSPGYDAARRPVNVAYQDVRPRLVIRCRSVSDVANAIRYVARTGDRLAVRGGGHCFAGRSSTDGVLLDLSGLDGISVVGEVATIGAGARLAQVYSTLHAQGRTLPAGCGPTVGIAGLTLGGGIGLLGRRYGLTCDRLIGVQVVLADGSVVDCDADHEPDLFWALRGAGGGQFGVVTVLRFATVPEPLATRVEARWSGGALEDVVSAWQTWAPDAPDELTVNLSVASEPGLPMEATLFGASLLGEGPTRELLQPFVSSADTVDLSAGLPFHRLKSTFADPRGVPAVRMRSEFFSQPMSAGTVSSLLSQLEKGGREIAFTAMGGAYNRVAEDATAFAHRGERFLLEHIGAADDPWIDESWATAHLDGSGRVYPNFPDPALGDWASAYHAGNYPQLVAVKNAYDPDRFFHFFQGVS
ncbi:FAD-binding oxidoreductase [Kribbella sp. NPDC051718]|uniref:FAD-binding oxidoreductase n=1 Tax=Kribbella sp. NPDC051718 TaxID=3155168 RepID=UPI003439D390